MVRYAFLAATVGLVGLAHAQCPYGAGGHLAARAEGGDSRSRLAEFELDDSSGFLTSDVGGPFTDQESLRAGERGPTLLEDFVFRQKIMHFDHERVPERAVHARGAGAHGTFTSYGDWSNLTGASFLAAEGKETPVFTRFSTVAGSRGSADSGRDVHGFATRFYTDEGNFDIVGNNIPVFFIQDAIQFPDLIHAVKPSPESEIPQAATAHDSAWDYFTQQTSTLHTVFWVMSSWGIPRSFRHMDGFGIHTYRLIREDGQDKLVKWHWKSKQGRASFVWDEAQHIAGKNADFHRADLWNSIVSGNYPEWELSVQIFDEDQMQEFGFDVLDPTKFIPEELVPLTPLGVLRLDTNPVNYFAETEQVMFSPAHIVRGVDISEDPLLQGRLFSYLDTQLNRHGGPNFEQLPINRPVVPVHNNNRDGAAQNFIHKNTAAYTPNTLNKNFPQQADRNTGRGFFTAPSRRVGGPLVRKRPDTFGDHWSQPRLFYNSLKPVEQQSIINSIRFEVSFLSKPIQEAVVKQLNKISHDIAVRVGSALGVEAPAPDDTYYHDNTTAGLNNFGEKLPTIATLTVGVLATKNSPSSLSQAASLKDLLARDNVTVTVVGETLADGIDQTYSQAEAISFDGIIVADGTQGIFDINAKSTLYPARRPLQVLEDAYTWGKPIGFLGSSISVTNTINIARNESGIFSGSDPNSIIEAFRDGLAMFRFPDRFQVDA